MAENVTLGSFATLQNSSIIATLNANNTLIEEAFADCLSLSGTQPNQMKANLDMNSQQVINLPAPGSLNSPVRLVDLQNATIGSFGSGIYGLLTGNNTWTGNNTFTTGNLFANTGVTGGSAASSILTLRSTSANGTSDEMIFKTGNSVIAGIISSAALGSFVSYGQGGPWLLGNAFPNGSNVGKLNVNSGGNPNIEVMGSTVSNTSLATYYQGPIMFWQILDPSNTSGNTLGIDFRCNNQAKNSFAAIIAQQTASTTSSTTGTLNFMTANAAGAASLAMTVNASGGVCVGSTNTDPGATNLGVQGLILVSAGTTSNPSIAAANNITTGISFPVAGEWAISASGSVRLDFGITSPGLVSVSCPLNITGSNALAFGGIGCLNRNASTGAVILTSNASTITLTPNSTTALVLSSTSVTSPFAFTAISGTATSSTATPVLLYSTTSNLGIYTGTGAPTASAAQGSLYIRIDGGAATALYLNTSSGSGTTWTAVT